jgi:hypothetical protein
MSEWVEHDGTGCPFEFGKRVTVWRLNGQVEMTVVGEVYARHRKTGEVRVASADPGEFIPSSWEWSSMPDHLHDLCVIAYRLHDNGEQAKREARIASLRKMAQPNYYDVKRVTTPEREKVK